MTFFSNANSQRATANTSYLFLPPLKAQEKGVYVYQAEQIHDMENF